METEDAPPQFVWGNEIVRVVRRARALVVETNRGPDAMGQPAWATVETGDGWQDDLRNLSQMRRALLAMALSISIGAV